MSPPAPRALAGLAAGLLLAGCEGSLGAACTSVFALVSVTVVDSAGVPVSGARVTTTVQRTGAVLTPVSLTLLAPGTYTLVDDGARNQLRATGDSLVLGVARDSGAAIHATYFVTVPGGCHVTKEFGPDTLMVP